MSDEKLPPSRTAPQFIVRFPEGMRERVAEAARQNNRSVNAEIIERLSAYESLGGEIGALRTQLAQAKALRDESRRELESLVERNRSLLENLAEQKSLATHLRARQVEARQRESAAVAEADRLKAVLETERHLNQRFMSQVDEHLRARSQGEEQAAVLGELYRRAERSNRLTVDLLASMVDRLYRQIPEAAQQDRENQLALSLAKAASSQDAEQMLSWFESLFEHSPSELEDVHRLRDELAPAIAAKARGESPLHYAREYLEEVRNAAVHRAGGDNQESGMRKIAADSKSAGDSSTERQGFEPQAPAGTLTPLRPHTVELDLTDEQAALVDQIARQRGVHPSVVLRQAIVETAEDALRGQEGSDAGLPRKPAAKKKGRK